MKKVICFDPNKKIEVSDEKEILQVEDLCTIECDNTEFHINAPNEKVGMIAFNYVLQTYQNNAKIIFITSEGSNETYQFVRTAQGNYELLTPDENNNKLQQKFIEKSQENNKKKKRKNNEDDEDEIIQLPKKPIYKSEKFDINYIKKILEKKNKDIQKQYQNDEEVLNYIKSGEDIFKNRILTELTKEDLIRLALEDSEGEEGEEKARSKFGKLRQRKGMGSHVLFAQAVVPTSQIVPADMMYNLINGNYESIKNKSRSDDVKLSIDIQRGYLSNITHNMGDINIKDSYLFSNELSVYFPEILTPFAILNPNQKCVKFEKGSLGEIQKMFKLKNGMNDYMKGALINFPTSTSNPLTDSAIYFEIGNGNYYKMGLSTKAGRNGEGASASVRGLNGYIFKRIPNINDSLFSSSKINLNLENYYQYFSLPIKLMISEGKYIEEIKLITIFSLTSSINYMPIISNLIKKYNLESEVRQLLPKNTRIDSPKADSTKIKVMENYFNSGALNFTGLIMDILKYASYDFAQVNAKQTTSGGISRDITYDYSLNETQTKNNNYLKSDWHYDFTIQYPAIFSGKIHMSFNIKQGKPQKLKFHILGNESSFS